MPTTHKSVYDYCLNRANQGSSQVNKSTEMSSSSSATETLPVTPRPKATRAKKLEFVKDDSALTSYLNDIRKAKNLTLAEEQALASRIQSGDSSAINSLVEANLKFVVAVCRNYQYQGMPMGDLINEGNLGLIRAARRFDGSMNFKFISYAVWWIRQGILTALAEQSRVMNISAGKITVMHRIGKASQRLEQTLGRQPTMQEVAVHMEMTEKEVAECLQLATKPISLNRPAGSEEDGNLVEDGIPDLNAPGSDDAAMKTILGKNMESLLGTLDEREESVIRLYYGIGLPNTLTLNEISDRFDLTRERIRQIKEKALQKLRHPSRVKHLALFRG
ncbi:MAG: DNA-directed polymerase sigma subunit RpoD [Fibrobacteres bacterium]|nr:DNA-directed polymerase sigma subunit RpoD [Fibrobacterota bacterium]